jgi:F-type H+-transporting ATPase subunit b
MQPDIQQILSQTVSFFLLFLVLRRFAWGPLLKVLDERKHKIEGEFRHAAAQREELARLQAEYGQRLTKIEDEARVKLQQAIVEGKRIAQEIQEQARTQSYQLVTKSKETIELELAKAKVTLRDQVAAMTVDAVEKVLKRKLDEKTDRDLVDGVLKDLEAGQARS